MNFDPVSTIIVWISAYGLTALFAVAFMERFVPVIPSYGLLLAVGIAATEDTWPLIDAFFATVMGNFLGATVCFYVFRGLGEARSNRFLNRLGRLFGMSVDRISLRVKSFRQHQTLLAFTLQLVPTVRLFAPAFAALLRSRPRNFLTASAAGIVIWNGLFISIGYVASRWFGTANTTVLTLTVLGCLLVTEVAVLWFLRMASSLSKRTLRSSAHSIAFLPPSNRVREHLL